MAKKETIISSFIRRLRHRITKERARLWHKRSKNHLAQGALEEALACCKKSLSIDNDHKAAYRLMAKALMPGNDYLFILSCSHEYLKPKTYVEIGVRTGTSLEFALDDTKTIGIDPCPCIAKKIKPRTKLYPITSDEFFEFYNLSEEIGSTELDIAFIDGLHQFDQVLKEFINLERYSDKKTVIFIHDLIPITRFVASRVRHTIFWCGDVWKVIPILIKYRPDLTIHVIPTPPSGLGIITNLDSSSTILIENLNQIVSDYRHQDLPYDYLDTSKDNLSRIIPNENVIPNEWLRIAHVLSLSAKRFD